MDQGKGAPSFYNTVKGYVDAGWNTYLINTNTLDEIADQRLEGIHHISIPAYPQNRHDNKVSKWLYNNNAQNYYNKCFRKELNELCSSVDLDGCLLYAYEIGAVPVAKEYSQKYGIKLITRFQGTILGVKKVNLLNRFAYNHHFEALSTPADMIIMTDDGSFGDRIIGELGNKSPLRFWRNGIRMPTERDFHFDDESFRDGGKKLMTVSRLANWKRVDRAISAMPDVLAKFPDTKLYIVGEGEEKEHLVELAENLEVSNNVIFVGGIPQEQVYGYINQCDIFLSFYDYSNVGNPLYEAMICGKTIITLNNGDTSSVIKNDENGILIDAGDANRCAKYIIDILADGEKAKRLGDAARRYAEKNFWSWDDRIAEELRVVEELLD